MEGIMLSIGARVRHPKAGLGKVLYISGGGLVALVRFDDGQTSLILTNSLSLAD